MLRGPRSQEEVTSCVVGYVTGQQPFHQVKATGRGIQRIQVEGVRVTACRMCRWREEGRKQGADSVTIR